jgi:hypothetical protein
MNMRNKELQKICCVNQPVPQLSGNLSEFILKKMLETEYDVIVEYGSGNSTRFFLRHLVDMQKECLFITVEYNNSWFLHIIQAIKSDFISAIMSEEKLELMPWAYSKCKAYLRGGNGTSLDLPDYLRRLPAAKKAFGGSFNVKMILYRFKKNSRPLDGCYFVTIGNCIKFLAFLRSEFMKDQYGESPIKKEYIDAALDPIRQRLSLTETTNALFMIDGGPRGDIVNSVLDLQDKYSNFYPTIFLAEAHRLYYADPISRRPSGLFMRGSNRTLNGEPVYKKDSHRKKAEFVYGKKEISPHELAEREIWFYEPNKEDGNY